MSNEVEESCMELVWAFGVNCEVEGGVHDLSRDGSEEASRNAVFYFVANTGVVFDLESRKQKLLQGHCNAISCATVSSCKKWIVTGDEGLESMLIVWDSESGLPVRSFLNPHQFGLCAVAISEDGKFIASLGSSNDTTDQDVKIWEWAIEDPKPLHQAVCTIGSEAYSLIAFNPNDFKELAVNGIHDVVFFAWNRSTLEHQKPPLPNATTKATTIGSTVFLKPAVKSARAKAVSGTSDGTLILWDCVEESDLSEEKARELKNSLLPIRMATKTVRLNKHGGITTLKPFQSMLIVGGEDQSVRFYDMEFRIVAWFEDIDAGPVNSISVSRTAKLHMVNMPSQAINSGNGVVDESIEPRNIKFGLPDLVIGTRKSQIIRILAKSFEEPASGKRRGELLHRGCNGPIVGLCAHPMEPTVFISTSTGYIQSWNVETKELLCIETMHPDEKPTGISISADGSFIAIGFKNGMIRILRWGSSHDFAEICCFHVHPNKAINLTQFSPDGRFLAFSDSDNAVGLYRFIDSDVVAANGKSFTTVDNMRVNQGKRRGEAGPGMEPGDGSEPRNGWNYLGRFVSHTAQIVHIYFGVSPERTVCFFSLGKDGFLVEYDLEKSSIVDGIRLLKEPTSVAFGTCKPTCCTLEGEFLLIADSEHKIKMFRASDHACVKTVLGPSYGGPIEEFVKIKASEYLVYRTAKQVVGLIKQPLDGNPFKSMGLIAHPREVMAAVVLRHGGCFASSGGQDAAIHVWTVRTDVLDSMYNAGFSSHEKIEGVPKELIPFLSMLDSPNEHSEGKHPVFEEIVDFFYYAQIRHQGEQTTKPRRIEGFIPANQIPDLMRALGFYPSEQQVQNILSELEFEGIENVSLETFMKLYLNHRPLRGTTLDEIHQVFERLRLNTGNQDVLTWKSLQNFLHESGESMTETELEEALYTLMGKAGRLALRPPKCITVKQFTSNILGFQVEDNKNNNNDSEAKK